MKSKQKPLKHELTQMKWIAKNQHRTFRQNWGRIFTSKKENNMSQVTLMVWVSQEKNFHQQHSNNFEKIGCHFHNKIYSFFTLLPQRKAFLFDNLLHLCKNLKWKGKKLASLLVRIKAQDDVGRILRNQFFYKWKILHDGKLHFLEVHDLRIIVLIQMSPLIL